MAEEGSPESGKILVVDDAPANLSLLMHILRNYGYKVNPTTSGKDALRILEKFTPDVILLDIMMPDMDGYEVCTRLKQNEKTADIPVIFVSALDETIDKVRAFSVGGVDFITKPFQVDEVLARVVRVVVRHDHEVAVRVGPEHVLPLVVSGVNHREGVRAADPRWNVQVIGQIGVVRTSAAAQRRLHADAVVIAGIVRGDEHDVMIDSTARDESGERIHVVLYPCRRSTMS